MKVKIHSVERARRLSRCFWRCAGSLPLLVFFFLSVSVGIGQDSPQSFWELRPEAMDAMLPHASDDNSRRYVRFRQYFADLHCATSSMEEQTVSKHGAKNLICVLPGKDAGQIVVAARYDRRRGNDDPAQAWTEAVMLPILYNALLAGRRQYTFVFAELCGTAGEDAFLRSRRRSPPKVMVVIDRLGLTSPWYYSPEVTALSAKGRERAAINRQLESEAAFTARLQGIPVSLTATQEAVQNPLLFEANTMPSILVYSGSNRKLPPASLAFRQDFEFLAYYLCRIDVRLGNPPVPSHP